MGEVTQEANAVNAGDQTADEVVVDPVVEPVENAGDQESTPDKTEVVATDSEESKKKSKTQVRIDKLTREKYEEREGREQLQVQLDEAQKQIDQNNNQQFQQRLQNEAPTLEQFDYDEGQFKTAYSQWYQGEIVKENQKRQQANQHQDQLKKQAEFNVSVNTKLNAGAEKYSDFKEVISNPAIPSLKTNPAVFEEVMASEKTADIAYYFGKNPSEAIEILKMNPNQARRAIFKLEDKLQQTIEPNLTKAPPPPNPVKAKGQAATDPSKMSIEEWMEWRNKGGA